MSKLTAALSEVKIQKNKGGRQSTSNCHMSQVKQIKMLACKVGKVVALMVFTLCGFSWAGTWQAQAEEAEVGEGRKLAGAAAAGSKNHVPSSLSLD